LFAPGDNRGGPAPDKRYKDFKVGSHTGGRGRRHVYQRYDIVCCTKRAGNAYHTVESQLTGEGATGGPKSGDGGKSHGKGTNNKAIRVPGRRTEP